MTIRAGQLKNSPLIYVLASIRFAPWPLLAKKIDEIHDELRETLPLINRIQVRQVDPNGQVVTQGDGVGAWMLMSSDLLCGVQFAPDQLLILCKQYTRYKTFEKTLSTVLETLFKHMRFVDVTNMGVRYVDLIRTKSSEDLSNYINDGLLPSDITGFEKLGGSIVGVYKSNAIELRMRCINQFGALSVPEDLIPLLAMSNDPKTPLQIELLKNGEMLLDIDCIKRSITPERMNKAEILNQLNSLHQEANAFFRHESVCKDHAFKVWKGEI